jgi:sulfatase maturation enzyme AslB (radical SAM superfamily)
MMAFHVMAKPAGSKCNLDCKYCFYLEKEAFWDAVMRGIETLKAADVNWNSLTCVHRQPSWSCSGMGQKRPDWKR